MHQSLSFRKTPDFQAILAMKVPRPGVEPGLEVPETSVMSFSLPGLMDKRLIVAASRGFENLPDAAAKSLMRYHRTNSGDQKNKRTSTFSRGLHSPRLGLPATFQRGGVRLQDVSRREFRPSADATGRCSQLFARRWYRASCHPCC